MTQGTSPVSAPPTTAGPTAPTILIDVDGTISDSLPGIQAGFRLAMAAIDHPVPAENFMSRLAGPPMLDTLASLGLDDATVHRAMAAYMEHQAAGGWAQTTMFSGWPELLQTWKDAGFQLSTATTKGHVYAEKVLDLFGIREYFDFVSAADEQRGLITKADVIANALEHFSFSTELRADSFACSSRSAEQADKAETEDGTRSDGSRAAPLSPINGTLRTGVVMIGDRTHDFSGARQFGIPSIAVGWGYGDEQERREATRIVADMHALDKEVRALLYL